MLLNRVFSSQEKFKIQGYGRRNSLKPSTQKFTLVCLRIIMWINGILRLEFFGFGPAYRTYRIVKALFLGIYCVNYDTKYMGLLGLGNEGFPNHQLFHIFAFISLERLKNPTVCCARCEMYFLTRPFILDHSTK